MIVTSHAYSTAMFDYTWISAIPRNGARCEVYGVFSCGTDSDLFLYLWNLYLSFHGFDLVAFYVIDGLLKNYLSEELSFRVFSNSINKGTNLFWEIAGVNIFGLGSVGRGLETVLGKFHAADESEEIEWFWLVMQVCFGLSLLYFLKGLSLSWPTDRSSITFRWYFFFFF